MSDCTDFTIGDGWMDYEHSWMTLLRCPICSGWLPRDFPQTEIFTCKKCGTELMVFPIYEDGEELEDQGKICPISKPMQSSSGSETQ